MSEREVVEFDAPLSGYMVAETIHRAYLPAILNREQGNGAVGRLLADLQERYDEVIVPEVLSERLAGMLHRRGYQREIHWAPEHGDHVECYVFRRTIPDSALTKLREP